MDLSLPEDFDGNVRLFPLPGSVVFPGTLQGLHIFEPRYIAMTEEALKTDQLITMATVIGESIADQPPAIYPLCCVGRIVSSNLQDDGRYNLILAGIRRASIVREIEDDSSPFRRAEVELVHDIYTASESAIDRARTALITIFKRYAKAAGINLEPFESIDTAAIPLGMLADTIAYSADFGVRENLLVLAKIDVLERARLVINLVAEKEKLSVAKPEVDPAGFPPPFSLN